MEEKRNPTSDMLRVSEGLLLLAEAVNGLKALRSNPNSIDRALTEMIKEIQSVNKTLQSQSGVGNQANINRLLLTLKDGAATNTALIDVLKKTSEADIYLGNQIEELAKRIGALEEKH
uniref:Uncharacterized protein n=1 Tax=viral metagenome TaxID=1070528 RepID=A0A6M3IZI5_9ZZZZ